MKLLRENAIGSGGYEALSDAEVEALLHTSPPRTFGFEMRKAADMIFLVIPVASGLTDALMRDIDAKIMRVSRVLKPVYDHVVTHIPPVGMSGAELAVEAVWKLIKPEDL